MEHPPCKKGKDLTKIMPVKEQFIMNAKKLSLTLSALVLGLTSCGGDNGLTRKEAYTKLDEIVAATPEKQTKLTSKNNTMDDTTDASGNVTKATTLATYVFDGATNYAHVTIGAAKTIKFTASGKEIDLPLSSGNELFAYKSGESYVFGIKGETKEDGETVTKSLKATVTSANATLYAAAGITMKDFAQNQIDAFVKCGREHWHNGAGGLSAYLKRQDTLDQNKEAVVVGSETIEAGATESGSRIVLKDEKYSSNGSGNLTLEFDALYPNPAHPEKLHEPLKFDFNGNLLVHWYNGKGNSYAGNEWTMTYGTAENADCTFTDATNAEEIAKLAAVVPAAIAALVAVDQPTATADLYPAHWGE